jgi:archaellum component FlaF (FlaF/FlaG flagellin family)
VVRAAGATNAATGHTFAGAESRALWLSATPAAAPEITIYENDGATALLNGPSGPACTAPQEPLDTAAPTFATTSAGLKAVSQAGATAGTNDVKLDWTAASDDVAVFGYRVYRDGKPLRNVGAGTLTYLDQDVVGSHSYTVDATDAASPGAGGNAQGTPYGNRSAQSDPVTVASSDIKAPTVPANLVATVSASGSDVGLAWSASTDNVKVTGYGVYRRTAATATAPAGAWTKLGTVDVTVTAYADNGVATGAYEYAVDAADAAGNRSAKTDPPATANAVGDTVKPSDVTGLKAGNDPDIHGTSVLVQWAAATDNIGVTGYGVYRDGTKVADVNAPSLSYLDANRPAGTYRYTVDAVDSSGNRSAVKPTEVSVVVANDPPLAPHDVIAFPARDFVSATGYVSGRAYNFSLFHPDGKQYASVNANASTDGTGTVEVNHPGGACWIGTTPNMKPGDVVRVTDTTTGVAEQTTVANVSAERPVVTAVDAVTGGGTVQVHGVAADNAGKQLPAASLENRLVANRDPFDLNGRRTVRAGGAGVDGTLVYDSATSTRWTATYTFQTPNDLARAVGGTSTSGTVFVGAESRAIWLGRNPAALNEQTIFENGAGVVGGPAGLPGCTDVAETPAPGAALSAAPTFTDTTVGSTSAVQTVTLTNNGTAPLNVGKAYLAGLNPGDYVKGADNATGATVAPGGSVTVQVSFKPTTAGARQANLSFVTDAANTTDLTVQLAAKTPLSATRTATAPVNSVAAGAQLGLRVPGSDSVLPVDVTWTGSGPSYQLQLSTAGGPFTDVPAANTGATSTTVNLRMGTTNGVAYQFQVRACAGTTCGTYAQGPKFTLLPIDDSQIPAAGYKGTWTALTGQAGFFNGTSHVAISSASVGQTVSFSVTGNAAWVGKRGPDEGLAQVQVDKDAPQVVDLYNPTDQLATVVWAKNALAAGNHTVTITVLGKKSTQNTGACNTGTKCAQVDLDMAAYIK